MKKKISDLLDVYTDPGLEFEMQTPLSSERIKVLTMKKITERERRPGRVMPRVLIAAAVIVALTLSAIAADMGMARFLELFTRGTNTELTPGQVTYINEHTVSDGQSQTIGGYTMTLDSYISAGGKHSMWFEIRGPRGERLPGVIFGQLEILQDGAWIPAESYGWCRLGEDEEEGWGSYLLTVETDPVEADGIGIRMKDLKNADQKGALMAAGVWDFYLEHTDGRVLDLTGDTAVCIQAVSDAGEAFEVRAAAVRLTAIKLEIEYDMPAAYLHAAHRFDSVKAVMNDGSVITMTMDSIMARDDGADHYRAASFSVDAPIPLELVDYIEFHGGTRFTVNAEE